MGVITPYKTSRGPSCSNASVVVKLLRLERFSNLPQTVPTCSWEPSIGINCIHPPLRTLRHLKYNNGLTLHDSASFWWWICIPYMYIDIIYVQGLLTDLVGKLNSTSLPSWKGFIDTPSTSLLKHRSTSMQNSTNRCLEFWANPASSEGCEWNPENGWISNSNFDVPVRSFQRFPNVFFLNMRDSKPLGIFSIWTPGDVQKKQYNHICKIRIFTLRVAPSQ